MPVLYLVRVWPGRERPPEPLQLEPDGKPVLYTDAAEANAIAERHNHQYDYYPLDDRKRLLDRYGRVQPRAWTDGDTAWRDREQAHFINGRYTALPWAGEAWAKAAEERLQHFAHVSVDEPGKLAYTPNEAFGAANRHLRVRPGKYLTQFFADVLSASQIRSLAATFAAQYEPTKLKFATEADDIERVYLHGPDSCMSHKAEQYRGSEHPVRAYAAGDLAIAYLEESPGLTPSGRKSRAQPRITARTVCWPDRKLYSRVYGDDDRLTYLLDAAGYTRGAKGCFNGARLRRIPCDGAFVIPYIDGHNGLVEDRTRKCLVLKDGGPIASDSSSGLSERVPMCACCDGPIEDDAEIYYDGNPWCESCAEEHLVFSDLVGQYERRSRCTEIEDEWIPNSRLSRYAVQCQETRAWFLASNEGRSWIRLRDSNRVVALDWADEHAYHHAATCDWYTSREIAEAAVAEAARRAEAAAAELAARRASRLFRGDVVECVSSLDSVSRPLVIGARYTVSNASPSGADPDSYISVSGDERTWYARRFRLVSRAGSPIPPPPTATATYSLFDTSTT